MAKQEEALPPWGALSADMLQGVFAALPHAASRGACRRVCRHWRQVADQGPEVWQYVHCRRAGPARYLLRSLAPTSDGEQREPGRRPPTLQELARLLSRQRAHLRRLTVEENAGDWENAAQALAVVLTAATTVGSGLTDLSLFVAEQLSDHVMEVLPGGAAQLTSLVLRPMRGHIPSLRWEQFGSRLAQLHSLSLTGRLQHFEAADSLSQLTALTRLRLANAHSTAPEVSFALLACPGSLARLELSGVAIQPPGEPELEGVGMLQLPPAAPAFLQQWGAPPGAQLVAAAQPPAGAQQAAAAPAQPAAAGQAGAAAAQPAVEPPPPPPGAGSIGASLLTRWQQLEHLRLHNCQFVTSVLQVLPHLQQLTMLQLSSSVPANMAVETVQQCSRLQVRLCSKVCPACHQEPTKASICRRWSWCLGG